MSESSDLRDQAARCRRLARSGIDLKTQAILLSLALEYDARALVIEERHKLLPEAAFKARFI